MKFEIRTTKENNIIQITTVDERWYYDEIDKIYRPSSTWISSFYPKGVAFYKWLAEKGWNEAEAIKQAAGNKGSVVHRAIEKLLNGENLSINDLVDDFETGLKREYTADEWEAIISFKDWHLAENPKRIISQEQIVTNKEHNYSGTLDLYYEKQDGRIGILDFKTSANIWPEMELQLSSYKYALLEKELKVDFLEILQVGYKMNKRKWKITELEDKFNLFLAAKQMWQNECGAMSPKQREFPFTLSLTEPSVMLEDKLKEVKNGV